MPEEPPIMNGSSAFVKGLSRSVCPPVVAATEPAAMLDDPTSVDMLVSILNLFCTACIRTGRTVFMGDAILAYIKLRP
jgi:hypothetical protein